MIKRAVWTALLLLMMALAAHAEVPLDGSFLAQRDCPAMQSINRQTNPGGITVKPGNAYRIVAANKPEASHYRIVVPGALPDLRWVAIACGIVEGAANHTPPAPPTPSQSPGSSPNMSWP